MSTVFWKGILLTFLLAPCFLLVSCGLFGSDDLDPPPDSIGKWVIDEGTSSPFRYWDLSEDELEVIGFVDPDVPEDCTVSGYGLVDRSGSTVRFRSTSDNSPKVYGAEFEAQLEVSDSTMMVTILNTEKPGVTGEITLSSVDEFPFSRDEDGCEAN